MLGSKAWQTFQGFFPGYLWSILLHSRSSSPSRHISPLPAQCSYSFPAFNIPYEKTLFLHYLCIKSLAIQNFEQFLISLQFSLFPVTPAVPLRPAYIFTTRCTTVQSAVLLSRVVFLCVRLFVTLVDHDHIGWKSWKLIAWTISPTPSLFVARRSSTYFQGNMEKFLGDKVGWEKVACWSTKATISLKRGGKRKSYYGGHIGSH